MAELRITGNELHVQLSRWERVGALSGDVTVPISSITDVEHVDSARSAIRGLRAPGTGLPGVVALGHWRGRGRHDFVAAYRNEPGYVVRLDGQRFDRLIVSSPPVPSLDALVGS